jgi:hypothetical protein
MPAIRPFLQALATTLLLTAWGAPGRAAPVELQVPNHPIKHREATKITVRRTDDQPAIWCWSHLPEEDGGFEEGSEQFEGSRCTITYHAPWVAEGIRAITLKVTDLLHPSDRAEAAIQVQAWPRIELRSNHPQLLSGESCLLTAAEAGVPCAILPDELSAFRVLEDGRGRTDWQPVPADCFRTEGPGLRFTAPEVESPTRVLLDYDPSNSVPALLEITIRPRIQIALTEGRQTVLGGRSYRVTATHARMACASWIWGTEEGEAGGTVEAEPGPDGWPIDLYHAPETDRPLTVHLTAAPFQDPLTFGTLTLQVLPVAKGPWDSIFDLMVPNIAGRGWMDPRPDVGWFALPSSPHAIWQGAQEPDLARINALAFVDAPGTKGPLDPVRGDRIPLHGHWLVAAGNGLWALPAAPGEAPRRVPLPLGGGQVRAMVTRRPGEDRSNPYFVAVFALNCEQDLVSYPPDFGDEAAEPGGDFLVALLPDGSWRILAGEPKVRACPSQPSYPPARFRNVVDLAMDEGGNVFAADRVGFGGRIWQVEPSGRVSSLAGGSESDRPVWDGTGEDARMDGISALAYDPSRRVLFAADTYGLRQVSRQGGVTTLPAAQGEVILELRVHGGRLFLIHVQPSLSAKVCLSALDLQNHTLVTLLEQRAGTPFRLGPIRAFSPDLGPVACAAVDRFSRLAITARGTCLLASQGGYPTTSVPGILRVDLGPLADPPTAKRAREHPERDEERKEPHPDRPAKSLKPNPS